MGAPCGGGVGMAETPKEIQYFVDDRETTQVRPGGRRIDADVKRMRRFLAYFLPLLAFLVVDHLLGRQPYSFRPQPRDRQFPYRHASSRLSHN
jgi:hypothetical protein